MQHLRLRVHSRRRVRASSATHQASGLLVDDGRRGMPGRPEVDAAREHLQEAAEMAAEAESPIIFASVASIPLAPVENSSPASAAKFPATIKRSLSSR